MNIAKTVEHELQIVVDRFLPQCRYLVKHKAGKVDYIVMSRKEMEILGIKIGKECPHLKYDNKVPTCTQIKEDFNVFLKFVEVK